MHAIIDAFKMEASIIPARFYDSLVASGGPTNF
jgi:hypothetical protein